MIEPLVLVRAASMIALLVAFGSGVFGVAVVPRAAAGAPDGAAAAMRAVVRRIGDVALWTVLVLLFVWLAVQAADTADAHGVASRVSVVPLVAAQTRFGRVMLVMIAVVLAGCAGVWMSWRRGATVCAGIALLLHGAQGHAAALSDGIFVAAMVPSIHLAAAGAWVGGVVALLGVVIAAPERQAAAAARWFSPIGVWCVLLVAGTAAVQGIVLVGGGPGLIGTSYGLAALGKIALFGVLVGFAWLNRYRLAPALRGDNSPRARVRLIVSLVAQTAFGVATVGVASVLSNLPPAIHEQPVWPFAWRPSLVALTDPDLRAELDPALAALACGAVVVVAGAVWARRRIAVMGAGLCGLVYALPHLDLLTVEAFPTSYWRSTSGFSAQAIERGATLFPVHCASCHGAKGAGEGVLARDLPVRPADLTAAHLWDHADGELFWWISHGMALDDGTMSMPGLGEHLDEDAIWALIDYVRANNLGAAMRETGSWPRPARAPRVVARCADGSTVDLAKPGERAARVILGPPPAELTAAPDLVTVAITDRAGAACRVDPSDVAAFAIIAGLSADDAAGVQFLVDPGGTIRAIWRPGEPPGWTDPVQLLAQAAVICRTPQPTSTAGEHSHGR